MFVEPIFQDRRDAGKVLAERVARSVHDPKPLVLALPRGGVPVGFEVARKLESDLDIFLVRKLGLPGHEELAIGAIASGGVRVLNQALVSELRLPSALIEKVTAREEMELQRREELYRQGRPAIPVQGRPVILVDDGLATGATMKAAAHALRRESPKRIIVAVPVAAEEACKESRMEVDEMICASTPAHFVAVGAWYEDFAQTTDEEVERLLKEADKFARSRSRQVH
jgi:putative phosphoribosyl transferase